MSTLTRIVAGSAALFLACIAGTVCVKVALRVHQTVTAGDPVFLFGRIRMDGAVGYFIPGAVGLVALFLLGAAVLAMTAKGEADER